VPVEEDVEEQEEESDEAEGFHGVRQHAVRIGEVRRCKSDSNEPEVREDEVEQQDEAAERVEEEGAEEENDGQNRDNFLIEDVVALVSVLGDEVGQNAHNNHCGDPYDDVADHQERMWSSHSAVVCARHRSV